MANKIAGKIAKELQKIKGVKAAYLFGSAAKGTMTRLSDIDVGIYMDEKLPANTHKIHLNAITAVDRASGAYRKKMFVDVVIMNNASPMLNFEIIKYGIFLFGDIKTKVELEARIMSIFLDRKFYYDRHAEYAIKRVAERGLNVG
ncbi:MAG: nucleotidyltransferase domain-containing protein [Candidatus Aenigmarchaeota archaeon]|nr:nucleotidyltransferase domain-containing protein [Candidatus Aenigmarchaeota archaeon]